MNSSRDGDSHLDDERAAFDPEVLAEKLRDVAASHFETAIGFGISRDNFERCAIDAAKIAQDMASAPVAWEAKPVAWVAADTLNSPHPTCISSLAYMSQLDRDRGREYVPLYAAPHASPAADGRDAKDAARWRFIRRKLCLNGNGNGTCSMHAINLPASIPSWPEPGAAVAEFCDAAIDAAIAAQQGEGDYK